MEERFIKLSLMVKILNEDFDDIETIEDLREYDREFQRAVKELNSLKFDTTLEKMRELGLEQ